MAPACAGGTFIGTRFTPDASKGMFRKECKETMRRKIGRLIGLVLPISMLGIAGGALYTQHIFQEAFYVTWTGFSFGGGRTPAGTGNA